VGLASITLGALDAYNIPRGPEFAHAMPVAEALAHDVAFRSWFIGKTRFAADADCHSLDQLIKEERKDPPYWWRHAYQQKCYCEGCDGGRETDIFNIFSKTPQDRFALHIEVKHAGDTLKESQAKRYKPRASCWVSKKPTPIPKHHRASTVLLYSEARHVKFQPLFSYFHDRLTFEEIWAMFPEILDITEAIRELQAAK
jgi:hypothetical protein